MIRAHRIVRWTRTGPFDFDGVGEHALYKVHCLTHQEIGRRPAPLGEAPHWMLARKVGDAPFKMVAGPYLTAESAQEKAERMEPGL